MEEQDAESIIEKIVETTEKDNEKEDDHVSYFYIILFYLLGTAAFAPHNFYITANEYWMYKFRDPSLYSNETYVEEKTILQKNFTANVSIVSNVFMISFLVLLFLLYKRIPLQTRIIGSMSMLLVLFAMTLLFIFIDTDSWQTVFFVIALAIGGLLSAFSAVLLISLFQLASRFPPRCLVAQFAGQNLCGILAAVIQIIALAATPSVQGTAALYYAIATGTIAAIMTFYLIVVNKSEYFRSKLYEKPKEKQADAKKKPKFELDIVKSVLRKLALLVVALVFAIASTGILHPGLTALVESSNKGTNVWSDTYFLPVCVYLLFNIFEFIGRETSNHFPKLTNIYVIFTTSSVRLIFLPLILLCNIQPRNHLPVVFQDDAYFIIFFIIFALSGGYLANIGIIAMNKYCAPEEKLVGTLFIVLIMVVVVPIVSILSGMVVNII
ncbi:equilibrative nucleoside transporter 3-like [Anoplophora glabripennis]|uniref:equilibrative nucleoside transporter 3-like n=1 Tax=Anoplophora glabripennis TaxID=217634 RepID=UPI000874ACA7|nr:equilibrative nucleoside transporter 3-like [Anoplophora glabripennis]